MNCNSFTKQRQHKLLNICSKRKNITYKRKALYHKQQKRTEESSQDYISNERAIRRTLQCQKNPDK